MDHIDLCDCVSTALSVERGATAAQWAARSRWEWLTEAELVGRVRAAIPTKGVDPAEVKVAAQGRRGAGVTQYDIEIVGASPSSVEAVFAFARRAPSPADAVNGDIGRMLRSEITHMILFFPRLAVGYRVWGAYDLQGTRIQVAPTEMLLSDSLQVGGLDTESRQVLDGVILQVPQPAGGRLPKWSVAHAPSDAVLNIGGVGIRRTVCGSRTDLVWAVVLSRD